MKLKKQITYALMLLAPVVVGLFLYFVVPEVFAAKYYTGKLVAEVISTDIVTPPEPKPKVISHIQTPEVVKAIYMSSWAGGSTSFRNKIIALIDEKEINAVVLDVKDYTGRIAFKVNDPVLVATGAVENRIRDIDALVEELHQKNIYIIGRVAVFQDEYYVEKHPDEAVKKKSDTAKNWTDNKGIHWVDAGSQNAWEYNAAIAKEAYSRGFDEINFDYIRFPADGNMKDIYFPISEGKSKSDVVTSFYAFLDTTFHPLDIPISGDIFGMTTINTDDLGIGQLLESALLHFDYVAPMVYPSHYYKGFNGYADVNAHAYDVVKYSLDRAVVRVNALMVDPTVPAESKARISVAQLRPWLQDFDYPVHYTAQMVQDQIKASVDAGVASWMLWDPANTYTASALLPE